MVSPVARDRPDESSELLTGVHIHEAERAEEVFDVGDLQERRPDELDACLAREDVSPQEHLSGRVEPMKLTICVGQYAGPCETMPRLLVPGGHHLADRRCTLDVAAVGNDLLEPRGGRQLNRRGLCVVCPQKVAKPSLPHRVAIAGDVWRGHGATRCFVPGLD